MDKTAPKKCCSEDNVSAGRKRKAITLEEKLDVIKRFERNERTCDIVRATKIKESTLRTIRDNADKIKASCISGTKMSSSKTSRSRVKEIEEMEKLLSVWIEDQTKKRSGTTYLTIKEKALAIYNDLKKKSDNPSDFSSFNASSGWFAGFKNRYDFHNIKLCGEAASADEEAAKAFLPIIEKLIEEEGYNLDQIFNLDETGLYWKRMPSRTYISKSEAHAPGFKAAKDRLTLLLGSNASGDLKLKPVVVYHSANPRALKGYSKSSLGVHFRSSKKGWMTGYIFTDLLIDIFEDVFENYCKKKNMDFKILLLLDNAPSHPPILAELSPHIKVIFLPPNTTSILQPMDQGVIASFKAYYLQRTFAKLLMATEGNKASVVEFWKNFNIKNGIDIIVEAWKDVTRECLHACWKKLLPGKFCDSSFEPSKELLQVKKNCVTLAKQVGFPEVEEDDVDDLLESHREDLSTEDLQQLVSAARVKEDEDGNEMQEEKPKELPTSVLANVLKEIQKQLQILEENDNNIERSALAIRGVNSCLAPYEQLLRERRTSAKQQKLDAFFKPTLKKDLSVTTSPMPSTSKGTFFHPDISPTNVIKDDDSIDN